MSLLLTAGLFALLVWLPGGCVARAAGLRSWSALAVAPGITTLLVAVLATALPWAGLHWTSAALPVLAATTLLLAGALRILTRGARPMGTVTGPSGPRPAHGPHSVEEPERAGGTGADDHDGEVASAARSGRIAAAPEGLRATWPLVLAVGLCAIAGLCAYRWGAVSDQWPPQAFDATFHLNAVSAIREGGDASLLGGLQVLYQGSRAYYPSVWHAMVALLPGGAPVATNGALLGMGSLVWPTSLAGMLLAVRGMMPVEERLRVWAVALSVLMGGTAVSYTVLVTALAVWPYALSLTTIPGLLLLAHRLRLVEADAACGMRPLAAVSLLLVLVAAGAVGAHGTGAFNLAALGLAWLPWLWALLGRRIPRVRWMGAALMLPLLAAAMWLLRGPLASVLGYYRPDGGWSGMAATAGQVLADLPMYGRVWNPVSVLGACAGALALIGLWRSVRLPRFRVWLGMWGTTLALTVIVGGPAWWGRQLGAPWYLQKARLEPLVLIPSLVLICLAWSWLLERGRDPRTAGSRRRLVAAGMAVLLLVVGRLPLSRDLVASVHDPDQIRYGTLVARDEFGFFHRAAEKLPPDAVVLGAPSRGASLLWAVEGVHVVYPVRSEPIPASPQDRLVQVWPDPTDQDQSLTRACPILRELGAQYLYTDSSWDAGGSHYGQPPLRWDGALITGPQKGLEPVHQEGDYALWRITACD